MSKPQVFKDVTEQFVICVIGTDTATNREFLRAFTDQQYLPLRFNSVNDCVLHLAKIGATSDEIDEGAFKFVNYSHIVINQDMIGRVFDYDESWFLPRTDIDSEIMEGRTHLFNLLNQPNYAPYCGEIMCLYHAPFDTNLGQFHCPCGWVSQHPQSFIEIYKKIWVKE